MKRRTEPIRFRVWVVSAVTCMAAGAWAVESRAAVTPEEAPMVAVVADAATVRSLLERVGTWQIGQASVKDEARIGWIHGALYAGIMALADISEDPAYLDAVMAVGNRRQWQLPARMYHADDHAVAQSYLEMYLRKLDPAMLQPTRDRFDAILATPATDSLEFGRGSDDRWSWCDALFMGPPAWIRLYVATGDARYLAFMNQEWWATTGYLYDPDEHLFFRDSRYFDKREDNGAKVFWSRGNGWVIAGLVRVLQFLPQDHPDRPRYLDLYREMASRFVDIQQPDGLWRSSLLAPDLYPLKETSGSSFICYGLAWGIDHRLLDRQTYAPAVARAWEGLASCVQKDGKLTHVQPVGMDPQHYDPDHSAPFGVGAFLLAGSEVFRLAGGEPPPRAYARYIPERADDIAWENDRIAFRVYGPALGPTDTVDSGIDVWVKSVRYPVIDRWYAAGDYHEDHGEGLDGYKVGFTRGCGGSAVWIDGAMHPPGVWTSHRILANGPDQIRFELEYAPVTVGKQTITQTKHISLERGANLNEIEDVFIAAGDQPLTVAIGIARREGEGRVLMDPKLGILSYWEPEQPPNGITACGVVVDPDQVADMIETDEHYLVLVTVQPGEPLRYAAGAGWSKSGDFPDPATWEDVLRKRAGAEAGDGRGD